MDAELELNEPHEALAKLDCPLSRGAVADTCEGVTLLLADGIEALSDVVADSGAEEFDSAEGLESEVMSTLPRNAVGEPFQSEGDA